jgi:hypothetical protein
MAAITSAVTALVVGEPAEVAGSKGATHVISLLFVALTVGLGILLCPPPIPTGENVLDALVGRELIRLSGPRGCEGSPVEILHFGGISGLGYIRNGWEQFVNTGGMV